MKNKQKKRTTESFKEEIRQVHGNKYKLDKVNYVNNKTKVILICERHGEFEIRPDTLLNGCGCKKCADELRGKRLRKTSEEFIQQAKKIHGDKYDYSHVNYQTWDKKVEIICPIHGVFYMTPNHHLMGEGCPKCGNKRKGMDKRLGLDKLQERSNEIHGNKYKILSDDYINVREEVLFECPIHGKFWQTPDSHLHGAGCPRCGHTISKVEDEIYNFITTLIASNDIIRHDKNVLDGLEIDIYIPKYQIGFEYNGLYWHTEKYGKNKDYHINKTTLAMKKGINLIQIFEDEWLEHKDLVLDKIKHFLHQNKSIVIGARKCNIKEINKNEAEIFLNKYHIQGFVNSSIHFGAFYNEKLVGVMSFLRENDSNWNLTRFASDYSNLWPGLANKIFAKFRKTYLKPNNSVKTFLDRRWLRSMDNVYSRMGFKIDKILPPDYYYVVNNQRIHKFNFRKTLISKKYDLPLTMTEKEMTQKLGIDRIWNCGLIKYVWVEN